MRMFYESLDKAVAMAIDALSIFKKRQEKAACWGIDADDETTLVEDYYW